MRRSGGLRISEAFVYLFFLSFLLPNLICADGTQEPDENEAASELKAKTDHRAPVFRSVSSQRDAISITPEISELILQPVENSETGGLSQTRLAHLVGMAESTLSNLELGKWKPWPKARKDLAKVLGTTEKELFLDDFNK